MRPPPTSRILRRVNEPPRIAILGAGRLGTTLAAALTAHGREVQLAHARDRAKAQTALDAADLVFLTVPDAAIPAVCASLRWRTGQAAVHCSGALGLDVLASATEAGALAGCLHPLQSFPAGQPDPARFAAITCGIEASPPLDATLERLAHDLGARTVRLEGIDRALYHAAAVFAANDIVALMAAATRTWALAGLPPGAAREALGPLLLAVAQNVTRLDLVPALTGPLARGDLGTIERHLAALEAEPSLHALYRALAAELAQLPLGHPPALVARLRALLDATPGTPAD